MINIYTKLAQQIATSLKLERECRQAPIQGTTEIFLV
jgi:hypothetical protein